MQHPIFRGVRCTCSLLIIGAASIYQTGCGTLTASQRGALLVSAGTLANIAGADAATEYGGPAAGQLASAGLSALGSVLQGYVGDAAPETVVQASPGVANIGGVATGVMAPNHTITQGDVDTINEAARLASSLNLPAAESTGTADRSVP
jgi:hypothetical protein